MKKLMLVVSVAFSLAAMAGVIYVTPEGTGSGATWQDAANVYDAFANAAADSEVWMQQGDYPLEKTSELAAPNAIRVYGGLAGDETQLPETVSGKSVLHSALTNLVLSAASGEYVLRNLVISNGLFRGVSKPNKSSIALYDCDIVYNGRATLADFKAYFGITKDDDAKKKAIQGRGLYLKGDANATVKMSNCLVKGNVDVRETANCNNAGYGVYAETFKTILLNDVMFFNNGTAEEVGKRGAAYGRDSSRGWALYAKSAPVVATNCAFVANRGSSNNDTAGDEGAVCIETSAGSVFSHCRWVGNSAEGSSKTAPGGIINLFEAAAEFDHCTVAYNLANRGYCAGLVVRPRKAATSVKIRNSIFWGNIIPTDSGKATDIHVINYSSGSVTLDIDSTLFRAENGCIGSDYANTTVIPGENIIYGDPRFVTSGDEVLAMMATTGTKLEFPMSDYKFYFKDIDAIGAIDVHLKSTRGRWNGSAWVKDDVSSMAIDRGEGEFTREPSPNGEAANLGCYGNTEEASMTSLAKPEIASAELANGSDYTRPNMSFTMAGGEETYAAVATLYFGHTAQEGREGWDKAQVLTDAAAPGQSYEIPLKWYFASGSTLYWRLETVSGAFSDVKTGSLVVAGENPPGWGLGGGPDVIHVKVGGIGGADGSNWIDAVPNLAAAVPFVGGSRTNIWISGTIESGFQTESFAVPVRILGGFAGTECAEGERVPGARALIDSNYGCKNNLAFSHASGVTHVERVDITRSMSEALFKTGAGSLEMFDCRSVGNGVPNSQIQQGRGGYFLGGGVSSDSTLVLSNCTFEGNQSTFTGEAVQSGVGAYISGFNRVTMTDVLFLTNGFLNASTARNQNFGAALYLYDAPITAVNVRFIGNRATVHIGSYANQSGSICYMKHDCSGSSFRNCLWLGNQAAAYSTTGDKNYCAGALTVDLMWNWHAVAIDNCTFAYNLSDGAYATAINAWQGKVTVRNSIFWGNVGARDVTAGLDLHCQNTAGLIDIDYSLLAGVGAPYCGTAEGLEGNLTIHEHMVYGDPGFVTGTNDVLSAMVVGKDPTGTKGFPLFDSKVFYANTTPYTTWSAHLRGRAGYTDETTGEKVAFGRGTVESPAIDTGDPSADFSREPAQRKGCLNLGYYGNTPWATMRYDAPGLLLMVR